jgi:DNA-directed RNA polymerase specialized sigma subunit
MAEKRAARSSSRRVATSHLWLAETLARRFLHRGEDEEDLLQVTCTWLVEASRRLTRTTSAIIPSRALLAYRHDYHGRDDGYNHAR